MANKTLDEQIYEDCHCGKTVVFNSEKELVKHIIWKDFETTKKFVTDIVDAKDVFSPAQVISEVHYYLSDLIDVLRRIK